MVNFKNKKVLVTGGTGMIGIPLVKLLLERGAQVRIAALDEAKRAHPQAEYLKLDLTEFQNCMKACEGMDYVFHVAGIKGSPAMCAQKPASFFYSTIAFNTHMLEAARQQGVERYLFTSSIGVYAPAEVFEEESVWSTFPSPNDRFAGWAKRMGELQLEAYRIQYGWDHLYCVRPANVFGPFDNFDPENAMVVPSLIHRLEAGENPFTVWGDGSAVRDFIFSADCARAILHVFENDIRAPVNVGCGEGVSIKNLVETLMRVSGVQRDVHWDLTKPQGDRRRILNSQKLFASGFELKYSLEESLKMTLEWYRSARPGKEERYNVFTR